MFVPVSQEALMGQTKQSSLATPGGASFTLAASQGKTFSGSCSLSRRRAGTITVEVNFSSVCPASQGKPSQGRGEEGGAAAERGAALARLGLKPWLEPPPDNCPCLPDTNKFVYIQIPICNTKIQIHICITQRYTNCQTD